METRDEYARHHGKNAKRGATHRRARKASGEQTTLSLRPSYRIESGRGRAKCEEGTYRCRKANEKSKVRNCEGWGGESLCK